MPGDSLVFAAVTEAVDLALDFVRTCDAGSGFIMFSDSFSVLRAVCCAGLGNPLVRGLLEGCHEILAGAGVVLCWVPGRVGVLGSKVVDRQAEASLSLEPTSFKIPFSSFESSINECVLEEWRASCGNSIGSGLLDIGPAVGERQFVVQGIGGEEVVLT